ncbi:MAG: hypothetical protein H0T18_06360 [Chloroflexia bacterium]|nr:hypothetical protein [Chloroflexia bacterium]
MTGSSHHDHQSGFTTSDWSADGVATLQAAGPDPQTALAAGLRGTLALVLGPAPLAPEGGQSTAIRGEGEHLAALFAELVDDLLSQIAEYGQGLHDVSVDGVLRKSEGGYVAWGYASGTLEPVSGITPPLLIAIPAVHEDGQRVVIRASFRRS